MRTNPVITPGFIQKVEQIQDFYGSRIFPLAIHPGVYNNREAVTCKKCMKM